MIEYRVLKKKDVPLKFEYEVEHMYEDEGSVLVKYVNGYPTSVVFTDGGESEDMTLNRDLRVLVSELNKLAGYNN